MPTRPIEQCHPKARHNPSFARSIIDPVQGRNASAQPMERVPA